EHRTAGVGVERGLWLAGGVRLDLDQLAVRQELTRLLDRPAVRRVPATGRELERVPAIEREQALHKALSERRRPDNERAVMVLQRADDDLGGGRRAAVNKNGHGDGRRERMAHRPINLLRAGPLANAGQLRALGQEAVRDEERLIDRAAAVAPHVQHDTLSPSGNEPLETRLHFLRGGLAED